MAITAGVYEISSAISPDFFLGRSPHEDRSLLPKSIVMLPRNGDQTPSPVRAERPYTLQTYPPACTTPFYHQL